VLVKSILYPEESLSLSLSRLTSETEAKGPAKLDKLLICRARVFNVVAFRISFASYPFLGCLFVGKTQKGWIHKWLLVRWTMDMTLVSDSFFSLLLRFWPRFGLALDWV
jgi:hypothetical protein